MAVAIRLKDAVLEYTPGGADDGTFNAGTQATVCVDDFTFEANEGEIDTTCGQATIKWFRSGQFDFTCSMTFKIGAADMAQGTPDGFLVQLIDNVLGQIDITVAGGTLVVQGIRSYTINGGEVPTVTVTLRPYGVAPTLS